MADFFAGFDCSAYPGDQAMAWLFANTGVVWCGYYLAPAPSHRDDSWMGERSALQAAGWGLAPVYVGEQLIPPGSQNPSAAKGTLDGADAAALMTSEGFTTGSCVYLDLEDGTINSALHDYVVSWCDAVSLGGFQPGVYCSHRIASTVSTLAPMARLWVFKVPVAVPHPISGPFPSPDPAGSGFASAYMWQRVQRGILPIETSSPFNLQIDVDTAVAADPSAPILIAASNP